MARLTEIDGLLDYAGEREEAARGLFDLLTVLVDDVREGHHPTENYLDSLMNVATVCMDLEVDNKRQPVKAS